MSTPWIIVSRRFLPLIKSWAMTGILDRTRFRWDKKKRKGWLAGWLAGPRRCRWAVWPIVPMTIRPGTQVTQSGGIDPLGFQNILGPPTRWWL